MENIRLPKSSNVKIIRQWSTPPQSLWLIFDFKKLSLVQLNYIYNQIKYDSGMKRVIKDLQKCYQEKSKYQRKQNYINLPQIKTPEHNRVERIPFMKKPDKSKKLPSLSVHASRQSLIS